jgi:antitoxin CptB
MAMVITDASAAPSFEQRLARARFRAWHRGTREADYMIGGFFDYYSADWGEDELVWFEDLLAEDDVEIMAWALKTQDVPARFQGELIDAMMKLDYVDIPR